MTANWSLRWARIGYRWAKKGKWNVEQKNGTAGEDIESDANLKKTALKLVSWALTTSVMWMIRILPGYQAKPIQQKNRPLQKPLPLPMAAPPSLPQYLI